MELTPQERQKIYLEEAARVYLREQAEREFKNRVRRRVLIVLGSMLSLLIVGFVIFVIVAASGPTGLTVSFVCLPKGCEVEQFDWNDAPTSWHDATIRKVFRISNGTSAVLKSGYLYGDNPLKPGYWAEVTILNGPYSGRDVVASTDYLRRTQEK